jgi:hypothetical protein
MTNRAAVLNAPGEIVLEDRAIPEPGPRGSVNVMVHP